MSKTVVLIPTYNERENILNLLSAVFAALPEASVVVIDDNSPDGTGAAVTSVTHQYPNLSLLSRPTKEGLGKAYVDAFTRVLANPDVETVVMMDADFSHDPTYLPAMLALRPQFNLVIGSRYVGDGGVEGWEYWRRLLSFFGNWYCRLITRMPVHDCTAGFNVIDAQYLRRIDPAAVNLSGYAFLMGLKYQLWRKGAKIKETPIIFRNRRKGESKITNNVIREGLLAPWKIIFTRYP